MDLHWVITFASPSNPAVQLNIVKSEQTFSANDPITITIEAADVDQIYEKAIQAGFEIAFPITSEPWGPVRRFWVKDPNDVTVNLMAHKGRRGEVEPVWPLSVSINGIRSRFYVVLSLFQSSAGHRLTGLQSSKCQAMLVTGTGEYWQLPGTAIMNPSGARLSN